MIKNENGWLALSVFFMIHYFIWGINGEDVLDISTIIMSRPQGVQLNGTKPRGDYCKCPTSPTDGHTVLYAANEILLSSYKILKLPNSYVTL